MPKTHISHYKGGRPAQLHIRINPVVLNAWRLYLKSAKMTQSDWIEMAICKFLGIAPPEKSPPKRV